MASKKNVGIGTVIVALAIIGLSVFTSMQDEGTREDEKAMRLFETAMAQAQEQTRQQLLREGYILRPGEEQDTLLASLQTIADSATGDTKVRMNAVVGVMRGLIDASRPYNTIMGKVLTEKSLEPQNLNTAAKIRDARKTLLAAIDANLAVDAKLRTMEADLRSMLRLLSDRSRDRFAAGFLKGANVDLQLDLRVIEDQVLRTQLEVLDLLNSSLGHWKWLEAEQAVQFDRDTDAQKFNELFQRIQAAATRQAALSSQLLTPEK